MSDFQTAVKTAERKMREFFPATPLEFSEKLSAKFGAKIFLKREDLSPVRSYKIRGALNFFASFLAENSNSKKSFVCASAGNHAQGFAFCCANFKVRGKIFMPTPTPKQKIDRTKKIGGEFVEIVLRGDVVDESLTAAAEICEKENSIFVPPFDHEKVIVGAGTIGAEIEKEISPDLILTPVGGGGICAGIFKFFENSKTEVFPVEADGQQTLTKCLAAGENLMNDEMDIFCDGTAVKKIGKKPWEILQNLKIAPQLCPENRVAKTILEFLNFDGIILEPSGALAIDALKNFDKNFLKNKIVVAVCSGGNFDFARLPDLNERAMKFTGRKKYFILSLPQRPGALREFLEILGPHDDIARFEYLKKSARAFGSILLGIETTRAENFANFLEKVHAKKFGIRDITDDQILTDFVV